MPVTERDSEIYEFGSFRLEVAERRLLREGEPISLTPKVFELLLLLVRHDGKLLRKQELMEQVWPGTAVEESNLMNNVAILRKALGLNHHQQSFIETVPRQGYRFQGQVRLLQEEPLPPPVVIERYTVTEVITAEIETATLPEPLSPVIDISATQPEPPRVVGLLNQNSALGSQSAVLFVAAVSLLTLVGLSWMFFQSNQLPPKTDLPPVRMQPLTAFEGEEMFPTFSPDGQQVAFAWDKTGLGNTDIFLTQLGGTAPKQVTDSPLPELRPNWSPDGKSLAFLRQHGTATELIIQSLPTGAERSWGMIGAGLDWSPDGKRLVIQDANPTTGTHISVLDLETGQRNPLTQPPETFSDIRPVFSPDGREIAFLRIRNAEGNLFVMPTTGGQPEQLTFDNHLVENLAWLPQTGELIFSSSRSGIVGLWRMARKGGEPQPVPYVTGHCDQLAVDRSGTRLVYRQRNADTNLWKMDLPKNGTPPTEAPQPLIMSSFLDDSPDFSPDRQHLVFSSNRTGTWEIWMSQADGSNPVRLSFFNRGIAGSPRWSPAGTSVVFDWGVDGDKFLYRVNLDGGTPYPLTDRTSQNLLPSWSPDGQWLYFCSNRSGTPQIWKMPAGGGEAVPVTRNGGWESQVSADGKYLFYLVGRATPGLLQLNLDTGEEQAIPELAEVGKIRYWAVTATGIFFATPDNGSAWAVRFFNFQNRQVQTLFHLSHPPAKSQRGLAVPYPQNSVVFVQDDRFGSDLMLVENFR